MPNPKRDPSSRLSDAEIDAAYEEYERSLTEDHGEDEAWDAVFGLNDDGDEDEGDGPLADGEQVYAVDGWNGSVSADTHATVTIRSRNPNGSNLAMGPPELVGRPSWWTPPAREEDSDHAEPGVPADNDQQQETPVADTTIDDEQFAGEGVDRQAMERVTAVMDEMVGERIRRNRTLEAQARAHGRRLEDVGEPGYVPTTREVEAALRARYGSAYSYSKLNPCVARYAEEHDLYRQLPTRPRQRRRPFADDAAAPDLPERARRGVGKVLGGLDKIQERLAALIAEEVAAETAANRRLIADLEEENAELRHLASQQEELSGELDRQRDEAEALRQRIAALEFDLAAARALAEQAEAARAAAEAERVAAEATRRQAVEDREGDRRENLQLEHDLQGARDEIRQLRADAEGRAAAEARRDEAVAAMNRLSAALEEERRTRSAEADAAQRTHREDREALAEAQRTITVLASRVAAPAPAADGTAAPASARRPRRAKRGNTEAVATVEPGVTTA